MSSRRRFLAIFGAALLASAAAIGFGIRRSFHRQIDREVANLRASARAPSVRTVSEAHLAPPPDPVQRWLRVVASCGAARHARSGSCVPRSLANRDLQLRPL